MEAGDTAYRSPQQTLFCASFDPCRGLCPTEGATEAMGMCNAAGASIKCRAPRAGRCNRAGLFSAERHDFVARGHAIRRGYRNRHRGCRWPGRRGRRHQWTCIWTDDSRSPMSCVLAFIFHREPSPSIYPIYQPQLPHLIGAGVRRGTCGQDQGRAGGVGIGSASLACIRIVAF